MICPHIIFGENQLFSWFYVTGTAKFHLIQSHSTPLQDEVVDQQESSLFVVFALICR